MTKKGTFLGRREANLLVKSLTNNEVDKASSKLMQLLADNVAN